MKFNGLPPPPTVNHYYTIARNRKILSVKGREYKNLIKMILLNKKYKCIVTACKVSIEYFVIDKRKRDVDNIIKPLLDALINASVIKDDSLIHLLTIKKIYCKNDESSVNVDIEEI